MFWNMEWTKWKFGRGEKSKVKIEIKEKGNNTCGGEKKRNKKKRKETCG